MQASHLAVLGIVALAFVGTIATDLTPAPTVAAPHVQAPAKRSTPTPDYTAEVDAEPSQSNVGLSSAEFDRLRDKADSGATLTDKEKRAFTDELLRRVESGGTSR